MSNLSEPVATAVEKRQAWKSLSYLLCGAAALLGLLYYAKAFLAPLIVVLLLHVLFAPVVRRLRGWGIPYTASALVVTASIAGTLGAGVYHLSAPVSEWVHGAPERLKIVEAKLSGWNKSMDKLNHAIDAIDDLGEKKPDKRTARREVTLKQTSRSHIREVFSQTWQLTIACLTTFILLFFMLARGDALARKLPELFRRKDQRHVIEVYEKIEGRISTYMLTITAINAGFGCSVTLAMYLLGLPNPFVWGVMAALLNYVPYLGGLIGAALICFVSLYVFDDSLMMMLPPLCYLLLNGAEAYFVTPMILGQTLSLSPVAVLLSLMFWGWMWGVVGVVLAVPLLIVVKVACANTRVAQGLAVLLRE